MATEKDVLARLRPLCLALPEAIETTSFGHPTFKAGKKTFAVLETYKGELSLALKSAPRDAFELLEDTQFYVTPYIGKHGWVSMRVGEGRLDWSEIRVLLVASYRLVASAQMLALLDGGAKVSTVARAGTASGKPSTKPRTIKGRSAPARKRRSTSNTAGKPAPKSRATTKSASKPAAKPRAASSSRSRKSR